MSATETCYCVAIQLTFSLDGNNLVTSFVCNCTDCGKITASMFASNFIILDSSLKYTRGEDKITKYEQSKTIETGNSMIIYFCSVCGGQMYRLSSGSPGKVAMRVGQVDDFTLHEGALKPSIEQFTKDRWLGSWVLRARNSMRELLRRDEEAKRERTTLRQQWSVQQAE